MPYYCEAGQSARVFFKVNGVIVDNIVVRNTPVFVSTVNNPVRDGQCCDAAYRVEYVYSLRNVQYGSVRGPFPSSKLLTYGKVIQFEVADNPEVIHSTVERCNGTRFFQNLGRMGLDGEKVEGFSITSIFAYDGNIGKCGEPDCTFQVKDKDGVVLFTKNYPQCPTYEVACGTNCPEGFIECGGKCVPCGEFAKGISALTGKVRNL